MFANIISNKWTETTKQVELTIELIVFDLGEITFGIPMSKIGRVINNLTQADFQLDADLELLDLHHRLFGTSIITTAMVIFKSDRSYCIPIDTSPTLKYIPLDRIRTLPAEFRATNPLGIASHVAMTSIDDRQLMIFILGSYPFSI
jgi:hypothetical protein